MELLDFHPGILAGSVALLEDLGRLALQPILPELDLVRMDPEVFAQFGKCSVSSQGRQGHLGLEHRGMVPSRSLHLLLVLYLEFTAEDST